MDKRLARRALGLIADFGHGRLAIRGCPYTSSLEIEDVSSLSLAGDQKPILKLSPHAGAEFALLDRPGIEATIDELEELIS